MTRLTTILSAPALAALLAAALPIAAAAQQAQTGIMTGETAKGNVLTDAKGMTLYTYDKDNIGSSTCMDSCAENWPPLIAPAGAQAEGEYGLSERPDGSQQWTFQGKPLYLWKDDVAPGDVTGDGVGGVWHAAMAPE